MQQSQNSVTSSWVARMAKAVKEDQSVINELAERINSVKPKSVEQQVTELLEDANYAKEVLKCEYAWSNTIVAKSVGFSSAHAMLEELKEKGVVYQNRKKEWIMKVPYSNHNLVKYKVEKFNGTDKSYINWTQKGRQWLYELVKRGILQNVPKPKKDAKPDEDAVEKSKARQDKFKTSKQLAREIGMREDDFEVWLHSTGIICWETNGKVPKLIYSEEGFVEKRTRIVGGHEEFYPVWTPIGIEWIKYLMKMDDPHAFLRREIGQCVPFFEFKMEIQKEHLRLCRESKTKNAPKEKPKEISMQRLKSIRTAQDTDMLMNLIEQLKADFECIVELAKDCIQENDEMARRLLRGDIRSINDSTAIMMRRLENECYNVLAQ